MKRLFFLLTALFACSTLMAQPVIKFEENSHNLGQFKEKKVQHYDFVFTNTGNEPLIVKQAYGSCGCTAAKASSTPVAPGEKGKIHVSYDGKGKFPGKFKKAITVRSNASNAIVRLYIMGDMIVDD